MHRFTLSWIAQIPHKTKHFFQFEVIQKRWHTSEPDFLSVKINAGSSQSAVVCYHQMPFPKGKSKGLQDFCLPGFLAGLMGWAAAPWTCCSRDKSSSTFCRGRPDLQGKAVSFLLTELVKQMGAEHFTFLPPD